MIRFLGCWLFLTLISPAVAQPPKESTSDPATEAYRALLKEVDELLHAARVAAAKGQQKEFEESRGPQLKTLGTRFLEVARQYPSHPAGMDSLVYLVGTMTCPETAQAREILLREHITSERIEKLCSQLGSFARKDAALNEKFLRTVLEKNSHRAVRAQATFGLAEHLASRHEVAVVIKRGGDHAKEVIAALALNPEQVNQLKAEAESGRLAKEAIELFEIVIKDYADVRYPGPAEVKKGLVTLRSNRNNRPLSDMAKVHLAKLRDVAAVGKLAPTITAEGADGKPLHLSDFRGRVVVLSFWGHWCAPCMAQVPHERKLVARMRDRPFTFLGINTDDTKDQVVEAMAKGDIPWRNWWDGGTRDGPLVQMYGVQSFPGIFVLDQHGVIRYRDVRGTELDEAVEALLKEMEFGKK
jgi:peroxiredoxin